MATTYLQFLKSPSAEALSEKAALSYITTTTVIHEPEAILKHFQAQSRQLSKDDKVLHVIENSNGASIETETTLKFRTGGGAYLPGIDDNLLDERTAVFPMVHIVSFDAQQKISQIRLYWEQGTLLKQIEAIGRNGRNWPIRDGGRLVEAVKVSIKSGGENSASNGQDLPIREQQNISATRDPHASLQLFSSKDPNQDQRKAYDGPAVAPRASAKPAPRDYGDLFVGEETTESPSAKRSSSPSKIDGRSIKAGAGAKFQPNRLFDENIPLDAPQSPERKKTYGQKYDHFSFGDGEDAGNARHASKSGGNKSVSHFKFEDFSTPLKVKEKSRPDQERHWGNQDPERSPERREVVHKPRPDAGTHYKITDDSLDSPDIPVEKRRPTTNVDAARRGQDFAAHYTIVDKSPAGAPTPKPKVAARQELQPSWGFSEPEVEKKIYKTAGDGMGGRGARAWGIGDESDPEMNETKSRGRRGQAKAGADN